MPLSLSSLFCSSQHPTIQEIIKSGSRLPPPREWEFYEDEKVTITTGTHQGQEELLERQPGHEQSDFPELA
ncbi:hypothetical protein H0H81_006769, partial [Sphagnurus paluster]